MNFKIGQQVRIASEVEECEAKYRHLLGCETVITSERFEAFGDVGYRTAATDTIPFCIGVPERYLEPLTNPDADAWACDKVREIVRPQPVLLQGEIA